jgi:hypothetical protein
VRVNLDSLELIVLFLNVFRNAATVGFAVPLIHVAVLLDGLIQIAPLLFAAKRVRTAEIALLRTRAHVQVIGKVKIVASHIATKPA